MQLVKENIERSCSDNIDAAERRAELREAELNKLILAQQAKHGTAQHTSWLLAVVVVAAEW